MMDGDNSVFGRIGAAVRRPLRALGAWFGDPRSPERIRLNAERWNSLPEKLRLAEQAAGRGYLSCGATHGVMERCDFGCTSCYLSDLANTARPLPFAEVCRQLDALRSALGPAGKAQVTSGEVTLLDVHELGRLVRYAKQIGLDPMVMTHGQRFDEDPDYLTTLVEQYGLEKVAIHVDATQRGRRGHLRGAGERRLDEVRDRFAALVHAIRRSTGKKLHAAHTVTVTRDNLDDVAGTMRWVLDNVDAFRMVSFQPTAKVGRTRDVALDDVALDDVWRRICAGLGRAVNPRPMLFGHPECHIICPLVVVSFGGRHELLECVRPGNRWDRRVMQGILARWGGISTLGLSRLGLLRLAVTMALRAPLFVAELVAYSWYRLGATRGWLGSALRGACRPGGLRVRPLAIVVHKFMNPAELDTPLGRERLDACVLRLPVNGRMVPMCEMNATGLRRQINAQTTATAGPAVRAAAGRSG